MGDDITLDMSKGGKYPIYAVEDRVGMRPILSEGIGRYFRSLGKENPFEITVYENPELLIVEIRRRKGLSSIPYGLILDVGIEDKGIKKRNTTLSLENALAADPELLDTCLMGLIWSGMNPAIIVQDQGIYAWQRRITADAGKTPALVITPKSADSTTDVMTLGDVLRYGFGLYQDRAGDLGATRTALNNLLSTMGRGGINYQGSALLEHPDVGPIVESFPK